MIKHKSIDNKVFVIINGVLLFRIRYPQIDSNESTDELKWINEF